mmetsp:Transcript_34152/g.72644  ORF Transcript_34152/g.72644 Transcript_34152/m.72644 type:complete len:410 (+) Transcript_34152:164-1393(+)|eukprot:CAMPEP_0206438926 /NCGR_PEP_ID=MMETSP0324_2-20121206/11918_1 /ASSEMBLY_ACC=CAM_ASM_000836 /TAXON_ID=2866 /ORGANISM="Crypthecodinium cohnii, Strain Seligo" /LENGTH=409 /DNA_ID=CAMNT_0053906473 /DNA_START=100 /DNA_END=1329 /DNA_ORIENTATION=+
MPVKLGIPSIKKRYVLASKLKLKTQRRPANRAGQGRCRSILLRPVPSRFLRRPEPLVSRKWWAELPSWIALYAERGPQRKCYEGHTLVQDRHDGRRFEGCVRCECAPPTGAKVFACRECRWSVCKDCRDGAGKVQQQPRLPTLPQDPLFQRPHVPCLLQPLALPSNGPPVRPCRGSIIVVPGGNYEFLCSTEGMPVAAWLREQGFDAFVLRYRLLPRYGFADAAEDLATAVRLLRRSTRGPVLAIGFSAGGHLVASHGILARRENRRLLDGQVLIYPAIDPREWRHPDKHGFWDEACHDKVDQLRDGEEELIGGRGFAAPPTFIVGSTGDSVCPPRAHSDKFVSALQKRRIPHRYLRGNFGEHGFALQDCWTEPCAKWLARRFGRGTPMASPPPPPLLPSSSSSSLGFY